jgi:hypothetical protein
MLDALISMLNALHARQFFNNISKQIHVGFCNVTLPKPRPLTLGISLSISPLVLSPFLVLCLYGSWQVFELW